MSEEIPFRSIKITLSEEALGRLALLRFTGSFRSDSATVEECIRAISDVAMDLSSELDRIAEAALKSGGKYHAPMELQAETLRRLYFRLARFVPKTRAMKEIEKKEGLSAGT